MKCLLRSIILVATGLILNGCSLFPAGEEPVSDLKVEDIQDKLQLGMNYEQLVDLTKIKPKMMNKRAARFNLQNGELWVRFSGDEENPGKISFWGTVTRLSDGTTVKKTSNQQALENMRTHPVCIDIDMKTDFKSQHRIGKCYYEQYGPGNIKVEAKEVGGKSKQVNVIFINGKYVLLKGDIPQGSEFKYLAGYMANLQLVQRLISKGMMEATPIADGKRSFYFKSQGEPFVIETLDKKVMYPEPWEVKGFVKPRKDQSGFEFDINFRVTWDKEKNENLQDTVFTGFFNQTEKSMFDNISLSEWRQFYMSAPGELKPLPQPRKNFTESQFQNSEFQE